MEKHNSAQKDIVIVGSQGHAGDILFLIEQINQACPTWNFLGFIDRVDAPNVIGDDPYLDAYDKPLAVMIGIGDCALRQKLYLRYSKNPNLTFPTLIDPSVRISSTTKVGIGCVILPNVVMMPRTETGDFSYISLQVTIGHDTKIGDFSTLLPGCNISGGVQLGMCTEIGTGAMIIQYKTVGAHSVIGAGAVVIRDIPANCTAVGNPARVIKQR